MSPLSPLEYVIQVSHTPPDSHLHGFHIESPTTKSFFQISGSQLGVILPGHIRHCLETCAAVMTGGANGNNQREGCCCTSCNAQDRPTQQNAIQSKIYRAKIEKSCYCPLSHIQLFATSWTAACQASLSFTVSQNLLKLMSIELMMPSNHLILCHPLHLLPSILPSIRDFSNEKGALPLQTCGQNTQIHIL